MSVSSPAREHDKIRHWIEERGGHPARVRDMSQGDAIRIDFGASEAPAETCSWEEFFRAFDDSRLEFLHREDGARRH